MAKEESQPEDNQNASDQSGASGSDQNYSDANIGSLLPFLYKPKEGEVYAVARHPPLQTI